MHAFAIALKRTMPLWLRWALVTEAAYALALLLLISFLGRLFNGFPPPVFGAAVGAVFGLCSGAGQALVLKTRLKTWSGWWAVITTIMWAVFWGINTGGVLPQGEGVVGKMVEGLLHGALFGAMLGLAQASLFGYRRNAVRWFYGNALVWAFCAMLADGLKEALHADGAVEFLTALPLSALLTAFLLQRLSNRLFFTRK